MGHYTSTATILKTMLESITNNGKVYIGFPLTKTWADYFAKFKYTMTVDPKDPKIFGWVISRDNIKDDYESAHQTFRGEGWKITGYYSLDDSGTQESETFFQEQVDTVLDKLLTDTTLSGNIQYRIGPTVDRIGPAFFGNVLCHVAEISFTTEWERTT
jgi:hypothetical protein